MPDKRGVARRKKRERQNLKKGGSSTPSNHSEKKFKGKFSQLEALKRQLEEQGFCRFSFEKNGKGKFLLRAFPE